MSRKSLAQKGRRSKLPVGAKAVQQEEMRRALGDITSSQINSNNASRMAKVSAGKPTLNRSSQPSKDKEAVSLNEVVHAVENFEAKEVVELEDLKPNYVGVEDIDRKDINNPQLCSEYVLQMFAYLRQLESRGSVRPNHLSGCPTSYKMREVLVDWLVEVQQQFKLLQETMFLTMDLVDRYMAIKGSEISRSQLQLIGVSAMFLACKMEEVFAPACSDFVYITDNAYTAQEIKQTELKFLSALDFNLFQPLSLHFLRRFSKAGDVDVLQHSLAKYALEVGLLDYSLVSVPGSLIAAAALFLSLLLLEPEADMDSVWTPTLSFYSGYSRKELLPTVSRHASNLLNIRGKKLQAIRVKYQGPKFLKIADHSVLRGELLANLAKKTEV